MRFLFVREDANALANALFDGRRCLVGIRAVAQHGSGEHVDALAVEMRGAAQVRVDGFDGALHALFGHGAFFHVRGQARHGLVVQQRVDVLLAQRLVRGALHLVDAQTDGVRTQIDNAVAGHLHCSLLPNFTLSYTSTDLTIFASTEVG